MSDSEKQNDLLYTTKNVWDKADNALRDAMMDFSSGYKDFLNNAQTERLAAKEIVRQAREAGYVDVCEKKTIAAGDKVYFINRDKAVALLHVGNRPLCEGTRIVASHIDSPRLDLKPVPLYEESDIAYLKTHYYGGIKKYQWTAIPLAMYGVVVTKGKAIEIAVGGPEDDMVFTISDLLPHLAQKQMDKKMRDGIEGESLNLITGSILGEGETNRAKIAVMTILNERYGIIEEDFVSAELEIVPSFTAKDVGFDRSMVGGYGQDDRVCSYAGLRALLDVNQVPEYTAVCLLADKEEVGSMGNTGMRSMFFENIFAEVMEKQGQYSEIDLRRCFSNSKCLSADVGAAFDPAYPSVSERRNTAFFNHGTAICKYTGSRGKAGSSDASAEFVSMIRDIFTGAGVYWQFCELGSVDMGGGGTVAQYLANLNIDVIDCGVALLSMHSPYEVAAKADIYMTYKGYHAFLKG